MSIFKRLAIATLVAATAVPLAAHAGTFTTLYTFEGVNKGGYYPYGPLIKQGNNLFGITTGNNLSDVGNVFSVNAATGHLKVLHTFQGGSDGAAPTSIIFQGGVLFGTTNAGGGAGCTIDYPHGCGTIFSLDPKTDAESILQTFSQDPNSGKTAPGGLTYLAGTIYGITASGGTSGAGSVFKFNPTIDAFATLYSFGGTSGKTPNRQLLYQNGLFYGTTQYGGATCERNISCGVVFSIDPVTGSESTLHVFQKKAKGAIPFSNLVYRAGSFIGSTGLGGSNTCKHGCGLTFAIKAATGAEKILSLNDSYAQDPTGMTLVGGSIYETVPSGGGNGEIVEIDPKSGQQTVLYTFTGGTDGSDPQAPLTYHDGAFYGTTDGGNGTIFKFVP